MGLDSIIQYYNGNEYTCDIPNEIAQKFEYIKKYNVIGFIINHHSNHSYVDFRGKAYNNTILNLTKKSLYDDLKSNELNEMANKLKKYLEYFEENEIIIIENYNECLVDWINMITDMYVPPPNEIRGLMEIFKTCYENNLIIYADY